MKGTAYRPSIISIDSFSILQNKEVKPIDGFAIPNIVIPSHLAPKRRPTQAANTASILVRKLFNSLTQDNMELVKNQLRTTVTEKATSPDVIEEIAHEILGNFLISSQNIDNYMTLLNSIDRVCVQMNINGENKYSMTIGKYFLQMCRLKIFKYISENHSRKLAVFDQDDDDDLDKYNRKKDRIINMVLTICAIYLQRDRCSLKLTAMQMFPLINTIMLSYMNSFKIMDKLGDPYETDCEDEDEYFIRKNMCILYADQLYNFFNKLGKEFMLDPTLIEDKKSKKTNTMSVLVERFQTTIIPTLTESYMISKCKNIVYE